MVIHCKMFNNQRKTLAKEYHELYMNNNTETRKNKHLNERERYAIELYLKEKYTVTEIAKRLAGTEGHRKRNNPWDNIFTK